MRDGLMRDDGPRRFATTHWTLVLSAGDLSRPDARDALAELCRIYWYPLYAFLRRQGHDAEEAQDLTQGFFARLVEKDYLKGVDQGRGRFRTFLLAALKHFTSNERDRLRALKRGGGIRLVSFEFDTAEGMYAAEPRDDTTPETLFNRRWALAMLERAMTRVKAQYTASRQTDLFARLEPYLVGDSGLPAYAETAAGLAMTEGAVRVAIHRLRRRLRTALLAEIAATVVDERDIDEELRHLALVLAR